MKKIIALSMIIGIMSLAATALAAPQITTSKDPVNKDIIIIEVDSGENKKSVPVTLRVVHEDVVPDLDTGEGHNYIDMGYTDEQGICRFTYLNDTQSGIFNVYANVGGVSAETSYMKIGENEKNEIIATINNELASVAPNGTNIKNIFAKYAEGIDFDMTVFDQLQDKDAVYQIMASDTYYKGKVKSIQDVETVFYSAVLVESVKEDEDSLLTLVKNKIYKDVLDQYNPSVVSHLSDAESGIKSIVVDALGTDNSIKTLADKIDLLVLTETIENATYWYDVQKVMSAYKAELNITTLTTNQKVYKTMMRKSYKTYTECEDDYKKLVKDLEPKKSTGGGAASGGILDIVATVPNPPATTPSDTQSAAGQPQKGDLIFSDMEDAKWAFEAVKFVYEKGIIVGVGNNMFAPNRAVTRAEAVKMLMAAAQIEPTITEIPFKDVAKDHWSYPYICAAYETGLVHGKSKDEFDLNSCVTKQELAVMAYRTLEIMGRKPQPANELFEDKDSIAPWAEKEVSAMVANGVFATREGIGGKVFSPQNNISRAETATVIYNMLK